MIRVVMLWMILGGVLLQAGETKADLLRGINQIRREHGLGSLQADATLDAFADEWAKHLVEVGKLKHRSEGMLKAFLREHQASLLNENLHYSWGVDSPLEALPGWMNSPPHRHNLLEPKITHAGLGIATQQKKGRLVIYVVFNGGKYGY